jgi:hypothetical protein
MESKLNPAENAYSCVSLDLNVEDSLFDEVVSVGQEVAGDRDYFEIGVRHILRDNQVSAYLEDLKKDDSVDKSE